MTVTYPLMSFLVAWANNILCPYTSSFFYKKQLFPSIFLSPYVSWRGNDHKSSNDANYTIADFTIFVVAYIIFLFFLCLVYSNGTATFIYEGFDLSTHCCSHWYFEHCSVVHTHSICVSVCVESERKGQGWTDKVRGHIISIKNIIIS